MFMAAKELSTFIDNANEKRAQTIWCFHSRDSGRLRPPSPADSSREGQQDLQAEIGKNAKSADFDLQSKCARDARTWFNDTWSRGKDTILLDYTNHYNKKSNQCFILVEYHYHLDKVLG
jgi:hypothetical protein